MTRHIIYIIIAVVFVLGYLRHFEYRALYFPMKEIEITPREAGLDYEEIYINTDDGARLNAWFVPAQNSKYTLLFVHGNGGNISHRIEKILILNELGLDILIFDYRGYGKSSGRPSERGLYRDVRAAYGYLVKQKKIASDRIVLYGESLGGAVALDLAAANDVRAIITESAFSSTRDMAKAVYPLFPAFLTSAKFDSLRKIRDVNAPKLIIHSRNDDIVPFSQSLRLFEAAPFPKKHLVLIGSHNSCYMDSKDLYRSGIDAFLREL